MSGHGKTKYSTAEEIANSITHGIGIVLAVAGLGVLTAFAGKLGNAWHVVGCSIYAATMILLFTASTLYHAIPMPRAKSVLQVLDHSAIYLLIAGTYTPFTLVNLRGPWGWTLFGVVWGMALIGILLEVLPGRRRTGISLALYVIMGWCMIAAGRTLLATVAPGGLILLILGGITYTAGIGFYAWHRLPYHHAIWHGFVLVGAMLHFLAILFYVIPLAG
jgi:hemolysin III